MTDPAPKPPEGFDSWIDWYLYGDGPSSTRQCARAELAALRRELAEANAQCAIAEDLLATENAHVAECKAANQTLVRHRELLRAVATAANIVDRNDDECGPWVALDKAIEAARAAGAM